MKKVKTNQDFINLFKAQIKSGARGKYSSQVLENAIKILKDKENESKDNNSLQPS